MSELLDELNRQRRLQKAREIETLKDLVTSYSGVKKRLLSYMLTSDNADTVVRQNQLLTQVERELQHWTETRYAQLLLDNMTNEANLVDANIKNLIEFQGIEASTYAVLPKSAIENMIATTRSGPLANLLGSFGRVEAERARQNLVDGLALGWNPRKLAPLLEESLDITQSRAFLISRTEMLRAQRHATRMSYMKNPHLVRGWVWSSACDERTCPSCWTMHGTEHKLDEPMECHPACRCSQVPLTKSYKELGFMVDEVVSPLPLGEDVFASQPEDVKMKVLGKAAYEAYKNKEVTLSDFNDYKTNPVWGNHYTRKSNKALGIV
jgi:SPP1 gp7 family putative phage head morphogenesis protein